MVQCGLKAEHRSGAYIQVREHQSGRFRAAMCRSTEVPLDVQKDDYIVGFYVHDPA
jgi:hypothetical protein